MGPFGTHGPDYERFYETLLFLERQEAFWKDQNDSENPEWFWCITRPVMDPLGPFGTLGPLDPLGLLGPLALLDPLGLLGPLALIRDGRLVVAAGRPAMGGASPPPTPPDLFSGGASPPQTPLTFRGLRPLKTPDYFEGGPPPPPQTPPR